MLYMTSGQPGGGHRRCPDSTRWIYYRREVHYSEKIYENITVTLTTESYVFYTNIQVLLTFCQGKIILYMHFFKLAIKALL